MARVPTWHELQLDAMRLSKTQNECYHDVHRLLDQALPDLDQKLAKLLDRPVSCTTEVQTEPEPSYEYIEPQVEPEKVYPSTRTQHVIAKPIPEFDYNSMEVEYDTRPTVDSALPVYNSMSSPSLVDVDFYHETDSELEVPVKNKASSRVQDERQRFENDVLRLQRYALPMPLSEYLKINRPDMVRRADCRRMYIRRRKHERRKAYASSRIISGFQRIKLSPDNRSEKPRKVARNYNMPEYQVECKLSEHEMRRLTAKVYRRLPEVVRRKHDEVNNYLKIQNYKNKKEYGRKLLENRRHGIINYPLRNSHDSRSLDSGHDDSLSSGERAADSLKSDPYY